MQPQESPLWRGSGARLPVPFPAPQLPQSQPQRQHLSCWSRSWAAAQRAALECSAARTGGVQPKKARRAGGGTTGGRSTGRGRTALQAAAHGSDTALGRAHAAMEAQQRLLADDVEDNDAADIASPATGDRASLTAEDGSVHPASSAVQRLQRDSSAAAAGRDTAGNSRGNVGGGVPITATPPIRRPSPAVDPPLSGGIGGSDDDLTSRRDLDSGSRGSNSTEGRITTTVEGSARNRGNNSNATGALSAAVAESLPAGKWNRKQRGQYFRTRQRELRAETSSAEHQRECRLRMQEQQEGQQQQQERQQQQQHQPLRQQERQQQHQHQHQQQLRQEHQHQQSLSDKQQLHQQTLQQEFQPPPVMAGNAQRNLAAVARAAADLARQGVTQPLRPSLPHDCVDLVGAGSKCPACD